MIINIIIAEPYDDIALGTSQFALFRLFLVKQVRPSEVPGRQSALNVAQVDKFLEEQP